jgi:hypothetical protein
MDSIHGVHVFKATQSVQENPTHLLQFCMLRLFHDTGTVIVSAVRRLVLALDDAQERAVPLELRYDLLKSYAQGRQALDLKPLPEGQGNALSSGRCRAPWPGQQCSMAGH